MPLPVVEYRVASSKAHKASSWTSCCRIQLKARKMMMNLLRARIKGGPRRHFASCFKRISAPFNLVATVTDALCVILPNMVPSTAINTAVDTNEGGKLPNPMTRRCRSKHLLDRLGHLTPGSGETEPPPRMCSSN